MVRALNKTCTCLVAVAALSLAAFAQKGGYAPPVSNDTTAPTVPITLFNGETANPYVRFTVAHVHGFGYCWGYLDVSATGISYRSLNQASDSFNATRPMTTRFRYNKEVFDLQVGGRNYDFMLVDPEVTNSTRMSMRDVNRHIKNPGPPMSAINNWDSYVTELRRELGVVYPPVPKQPVAPPRPTVGRVMLTTQPGGAQVYVDDVFKGASSEKGLLTVEASPGSHTVRVNHADFKEWSQSVYFANESGTPLSVTLVRNGPEPLSEDEIEQGLAAGITPARMTDKVKELGVNFTLTDDIEKKLRAAGADSDLLLEIAKNKR